MIGPAAAPDAAAGAGPVSTAYAWAVSSVAASAGLLFGFDIAVINGALLSLRRSFGLTESEMAFAASALLIGCVAGAAVAGWLSDALGRRKVLGLCAILFALSSIGAALPRNLAEFAVARFAGGVSIGMASLLAPLYIAETAPARLRGRLVALNQMTIVSGILLAYLVNWSLAAAGPEPWRPMFAVAAVPAVVFLAALFFVPESPRWLVQRGREAEAEGVLLRVGGREEAALAMGEIRAALAEETGTLRELFEPGLRRALVLAIGLAVLQQWTGINTIFFYGSVILADQLGSNDASALLPNVLIGLVNAAATVFALFYIDRWGRKPLLIASTLGMGAMFGALSLAFRQTPPASGPVIGAMLGAAAMFAVGLGPAVWVMLSEIFPNRIRGRAFGLATMTLWIACVVLTGTFPAIASGLGAPGAFALYGAICLFTAIFVAGVAPETRGRTLEQIETLWKKERP
jgi:SP family arabinose:H+ symporter-like MFS transporter